MRMISKKLGMLLGLASLVLVPAMAGRAAAQRFGKDLNVRFDYVALIGSQDRPEIRYYVNVIEGFDL